MLSKIVFHMLRIWSRVACAGRDNRASHFPHLPSLPRQALFILCVVYTGGYLLVVPNFLAHYLYNALHGTLEQATYLSRITNLKAQNNLGAHEHMVTLALPLSGFIASTADGVEVTVKLQKDITVANARQIIDLKNSGLPSKLNVLRYIFSLPADSLLKLRHSTSDEMANVQALITAGIFQKIMLMRIGYLTGGFLCLMVLTGFLFYYFVRRSVARALDNLTLSLYGPQTTDTSFSATAGQLKMMQARLQEHADAQARLALLGTATGRLAHDLRNLLASLQLSTERMVADDDEKQKKIGTRLLNAIEQAISLVDWAVMYTSRKPEIVKTEAHKVAPLVDEVLNFVRLHDPMKKIKLVNACVENVSVMVERTLLFRVLYNLSLNAVQAMKTSPPPHELTIYTRSDDEATYIRISDTGPGVSSETIDTLKDTGLGLKIALDLIGWHGGTLTLSNSDATGTQFLISLPHIVHTIDSNDANNSNDSDIAESMIDPSDTAR